MSVVDVSKRTRGAGSVRTSFPGAMSRSATRRRRGSSDGEELGARGNTITAFGSHEWLANATEGAMQIPIGVRDGSVRVNVLVVNYGYQRGASREWA